MKKLTLMLTVALMAIATTASAQFANSGKSGGAVADTENYNRVTVAYNALNIEKIGLTGISAGWLKGISLMDSKPLFLEVGANVMYGFGKDDFEGGYDADYDDWDDWDYGDYEGGSKPKFTYLGVNVPVLVTYKFALSDKFTLAPYAGANLRGNIIMKAKQDGYKMDFFDKPEEGGVDAKRFCVGASFGVNVDIDKWMVGIGYTTDFTEVAKKTNIDYFSITLGMKF